ncbi:ArsR/SmtB family transcription factor [Coralliovum pocilloporae]|uniref:ArsR/SmtB family transcription factor n=1 Tax=Coralliovum pocilloporae TaxID=3066369 RepID=UPI0033076A78
MELQRLLPSMDEAELGRMTANAKLATEFMKALTHEGRLMILCHLVSGEKSVTELERLLATRQSAVSQQLSRLRLDGLVDYRRDGKTLYYRISDPKVERMLALVYDMFCD